MKYQELNFQMIGLAILHRWKTIACTVAVFLVLGVVSSFLFADRTSAEGSGSAPEWIPVSFEDVDVELEYYIDCYTKLSEESSALFTYVDTVRLDNTLTEEQSQRLQSLCEEITDYQKESLHEISKVFSASDAYYIPTELRQDAVDRYTQLKDDTQREMVKAENAMTLIQAIGGLTSTNEEINSTYASLLSQAAQYGQLQLNLEKYENILDRLENDFARVQADSKKMKSMLEQAAAELDALGTDCYQSVQEIALENHLNISTSADGTELKVRINHTNRPVTEQEAFAAFMLFFGLVGICAGGFFALWKEYVPKKENGHV